MKKNVALLAGGDSGEYEVSLRSAAMVEASLDRSRYDVYTIQMYGRDWSYETGEGIKIPVDKNDFSLDIQGVKIHFDVVFMMIHGTPGEDGILQGYFELLDIPCTCSDLFTSSLTFNKYFTNQHVRMLGIITPFSHLLLRGKKYDMESIAKDVGFPCFVKPNCGGSSLGTTRVNRKQDLKRAIDNAFAVDEQVLVEEFVDGTEVTCGLIRKGKQTLIFPLTEIVPKNEFFDYEAKYTKGMADEITPARISQDATLEVKRLSNFIYNKFFCKGIVRVDFILKDKEYYFLEVNTVPGMSEASIVPQQIRAAGIKESEIFTLAIENAIAEKQA
ncbi:MAG: D-alanine--D-alanine ligase [Bacteroidales bacterium]